MVTDKDLCGKSILLFDIFLQDIARSPEYPALRLTLAIVQGVADGTNQEIITRGADFSATSGTCFLQNILKYHIGYRPVVGLAFSFAVIAAFRFYANPAAFGNLVPVVVERLHIAMALTG